MSDTDENGKPYNNRDLKTDEELFTDGYMKLPSALKTMGYSGLREGQDRGVFSILGGNDTICIFPTATGKSAVFIVPTLCHDWKTLVICPLKALMRDQVKKLQEMGVAAFAISSDSTDSENRQSMADWAAGECQLLYVSPERLGNPDFLKVLDSQPPDMITIDECFTPETEIMTDKGFVAFKDLTDEHLVMEVCQQSRRSRFVKPEKIIKKPYKGRMVRMFSKQLCDLTMTPGHELLTFSKYGVAKKECVDTASFGSHKYMLAAAPVEFGSYEGHHRKLSFHQRLQIAYQADGSLHRRNVNGKISASFTFRKERKIERFEKLMKALNIKYEETKPGCRNQRRFIAVGLNGMSKRLDEMFDLKTMSAEFAKAFIDEASYWDGSRCYPGMIYYSSAIKENSDFVQAVATIAGYKTNLVVQHDARSQTFSDMHRLFIQTENDRIGTARLKRRDVEYDGEVHCVRVPAGNIVVRGNGKTMVIGNCHCLSAWSDNFRHAYTFIGDIIERYNPRVVSAFTATFSKMVEQDVRRVLRLPKAVKITHFPVRKNLKLSSSYLNDDSDLFEMVQSIDGPVLVYCGTQKLTEKMASRLSKILNEEVGYYHAEVAESIKKQYQDSFLNNRLRVMCATNAFGMGVDKPNIRGLIHYMHPGDPEALSQELGRAGRDGEQSYCHTFESREAKKLQNGFIDYGHPPRNLFEKTFAAMTAAADPSSGVFHMTYAELEARSNVFGRYLESIMQTLLGAKVIVNSKDHVVVHKVRFVQEEVMDGSALFEKFRNLIEEIGSREKNEYLFDMDLMASKMDVNPDTVKKYLKQWQSLDAIAYTMPPRSAPKRIIGDLGLVDFSRLAYKREEAFKKLQYVLDYFKVPDHDKHAYLQDYFLEHDA